MIKQWKAWAIDTNTKEGHGFIGRLWWFFGKRPIIDSQSHGCMTCLWTTRKEARRHLPNVRDYFKKAKVVRVRVTIEQMY